MESANSGMTPWPGLPARQRAERTSIVRDANAEFVDVPIDAHSPVIGKPIAALGLPRAAVLVSIRRGHRLVIPHGDTRLQAGDIVTALCEREHIDEIKSALNESAAKTH